MHALDGLVHERPCLARPLRAAHAQAHEIEERIEAHEARLFLKQAVFGTRKCFGDGLGCIGRDVGKRVKRLPTRLGLRAPDGAHENVGIGGNLFRNGNAGHGKGVGGNLTLLTAAARKGLLPQLHYLLFG